MFDCCGVNGLHALLGGVVSLALGSVWYSSFMFGNCTTNQAMPQRSIGACFLMEFVNSAIGSWALFALLNLLEAFTLSENLYYAFLIALASAVPARMADYIWKGQSLNDTLICASFSVALALALTVMRSYLI